MITKERKAEIARENGAKSKGPLTHEAKQQAARNAITHSEHAKLLKLILQSHFICLATEERRAPYKLSTAKYRR